MITSVALEENGANAILDDKTITNLRFADNISALAHEDQEM